MSAETQIANLLYRYAEFMDSGDISAAAALFEHARLRVGGTDRTIDAETMLKFWKGAVLLDPDGTPRTKHLVTNPIIEVDDDAGTASCRSCFTVIQQLDGLAPETIVTGRYHDEFERVAGLWRFSFRDFTLIDMVGDVSRHLTRPIEPIARNA
jgi:3-phenylpropionate/cinnamic acid dioxygenase small subunit